MFFLLVGSQYSRATRIWWQFSAVSIKCSPTRQQKFSLSSQFKKLQLPAPSALSRKKLYFPLCQVTRAALSFQSVMHFPLSTLAPHCTEVIAPWVQTLSLKWNTNDMLMISKKTQSGRLMTIAEIMDFISISSAESETNQRKLRKDVLLMQLLPRRRAA